MRLLESLKHMPKDGPKPKFESSPKPPQRSRRPIEKGGVLNPRVKARKLLKRAVTTPRESTGQHAHPSGKPGTYPGHAITGAKGTRASRKITARATLADSSGSNRPAPKPHIKGVPPAFNADLMKISDTYGEKRRANAYSGDGRLERPAPKRRRRRSGNDAGSSSGGYDY
jgi:hypothetical protein